MKKYVTKNDNLIKFTLDYNKGGVNYFTGKVEKRGYYITAKPVTISKGQTSDGKEYEIETYTCMSGYRYLLLETKRSSEKSHNQSIELFNNEINLLLKEF